MQKKFLIVNTGSTSEKYSIYEDHHEVFFAQYEKLESGSTVSFYDFGRAGEKRTNQITIEVFETALKNFIDEAISKEIIMDKSEISKIGLRIVSPGIFFQQDRIIDEDFLQKLKAKQNEAPIHISISLKEYEKIKTEFSETPIIGISDSAFHATVPDFVKYYAIPKNVSDDLELYHYGYHGISIASIVAKLKTKISKLPKNIIICHLGGGGSIVAVKNGKSFNTSMGYSPLEGIIMATRSGDIDPVAVLNLGEKLNKDKVELEKYFNNECGLLGLSGKSSSVKDLIELEKRGDKDASLAIEKYAMAIKKYIGAYSAQMGGVDMIVFSGTVGERSFAMREKILSGLEYLGVKFNKSKNNKSEGVEVKLSTWNSKVKVLVILTDEMEDMAKKLEGIV